MVLSTKSYQTRRCHTQRQRGAKKGAHMDTQALTKLSYGLYTVSVEDPANARPAGFIIDAVAQISMDDPPTVIVSVMNRNYSKDCIAEAGVFNLSVLPADVDPFLIANFGYQSSKDVAKWANVPHTIRAGLPVPDCAVSWAQLKVIDKRVMGTHTSFFTQPVEAELLVPDGQPLLYADYFKELKTKAMDAFTAWKEENA
jgi:flavin reductase (DIM6/NTAB) family NADH-FMN oxidoreductase RutF